MAKEDLRAAWQETSHAQYFDAWAEFSNNRLRGVCESFNEVRSFLKNKHTIQGRDLLEIACATGEFSRYINTYHSEFHYRGLDISEPAIHRARAKYPTASFDLCRPDLSDVVSSGVSPTVLWARDVVHHQPDPFEYLSTLLSIAKEVTVLRIRTRDNGASIIDPEISCQWHYNHWVPYIILNIDEVLGFIQKTISVKKIFVAKRYVQLGGLYNRFVPKDCYYPETGTAETALYIEHSSVSVNSPEIVISQKEDTDYVAPLWLRGVTYMRRKYFLK